jgi:hypothetical protein
LFGNDYVLLFAEDEIVCDPLGRGTSFAEAILKLFDS